MSLVIVLPPSIISIPKYHKYKTLLGRPNKLMVSHKMLRKHTIHISKLIHILSMQHISVLHTNTNALTFI
jgi:hypothetical protein